MKNFSTILTILLLGVFAISAGGGEMIKNQVSGQMISVLVTIVWSGVVAIIAIKIADECCGGIRSSEDDKTEGLDLADHGEDANQI